MNDPAFLPDFLPDELLFGILARHRRLIGSPPAARHVEALFGNCHAVAAVDMPLGLATLGMKMGGLDPVGLALNHTLFPYYAAFQPDVRRDIALDAVLKGRGQGVKMSLGVVTARIQPMQCLLYCPKCVEQAVELIGEGVWIRSHQLPGNVVCHIHGDVLLTAGLDRRGRHEFWAPDFVSLPMEPDEEIPDAAKRRLHQIATAQSALLLAGRRAKPATDWGNHYRFRLAETGFVPAGRQVDQERLEAQFIAFYGDALGYLPPAVRTLGERGWLMSMSRTHEKAFHPLFHVLLTLFLDAQTRVIGPFGEGPWPCMNPLADHHGDDRIFSVHHYANRSDRIGVFSCDCGYSYTRSVRPDGSIGRVRFKKGGPLLEAKIRELVVPGAKLRAVARECGLNPKTLIREALSLGLAVPWSTKPSGKPRISREMKGSDPAETNRCAQAYRRRLDWEKIDCLVCQNLEMVEREIRSRIPVERVTFAALERGIKKVGWLAKRRAKLPRANELARARIETLDAYRVRRAQIVAAMMPGASAWQIARAAGLPGSELALAARALSDLGNQAKSSKRHDAPDGEKSGAQ